MSIRKKTFADIYPPIKEQFTIFPNEFFDELNRYLSPKQAIVFFQLWRLIHGFNKRTGQIGAGVLAERTGLSLPTIKRAVQELIDLGLVILVKKGGGSKSNEYAICRFNEDDLNHIKSINSANLASENDEPQKAKKPTKKDKSDQYQDDTTKQVNQYQDDTLTIGSAKSDTASRQNLIPEPVKSDTGKRQNLILGSAKSDTAFVHKENLNTSTKEKKKEKEKQKEEKISLSKDPLSGVIKESKDESQTRKTNVSSQFIENTIAIMDAMTGGNRKNGKTVQESENVQAEIEGSQAGGGYPTPIQPAETSLEPIGIELEAFKFDSSVDSTFNFLTEVFAYCEREGIEYSRNSKDSSSLWNNSESFRTGILSPVDILSRMKKHSDMRKFARDYKDIVKDRRFSEHFRTIISQPVSVANSLNGWGAIIESTFTMYDSLIQEISKQIEKERKSKQIHSEINEIRRRAKKEMNGEPKETIVEVVTNGKVEKVVEYEPYIPSEEVLQKRIESRKYYPGLTDEEYHIVKCFLELDAKDDPRKMLYRKQYFEYMVRVDAILLENPEIVNQTGN